MFKRQKPPRSLHWKEIERIIRALGAEHVGDHGDHKKFRRDTAKRSFVIILPTYTDISRDLLADIIRQTGVSKKVFWAVYFGKAAKGVIRETTADQNIGD